MGNRGWSFDECLHYFRKAETWEEGENEFHGGSGPLRTCRVKEFHPLTKAWFEAGRQAGYPFTPDVNGASQEGFGPLDSTLHRGRRASTAQAYLKPALARTNLRVITRALASRVVVQGGRATGVEYVRNGRTEVVQAGREVILAGGAINSPQLLQLSGIGNGEHLRSVGIKPVHELPGVGRNLQDHLAVSIQELSREPISLLRDLQPLNVAKSLLQYAVFRTGPVAHPGIQGVAFIKTRPEIVAPDLQFHFIMVLYSDHGRQITKQHGYMPLLNVQRPESVGTVMIRSANPQEHPVIDPNYLASGEDLRVLRDGIRIGRDILAQNAFDPYRGGELSPGRDVRTDAQIDDYIRRTCVTQYHPVGTCKMGRDPMAVVDPELKVHGLDGLRVVDASIMPAMVSANTNAATIMIAEKGSDMILARTSAAEPRAA
jgi:choline dehydrogenase